MTPAWDLAARTARRLEAKTESDFFHPDYKKLAFMPKEFRLLWRCTERCSTCSEKNSYGNDPFPPRDGR